MKRRRFLKSTAGLFISAATALILPKLVRAQGGMGPGPGMVHSTGGSTTTWNPADKDAGITLSNGNLTAAANTGGDQCARGAGTTSTAKVYWENTINTRNSLAGNFNVVAVANATWALTFVGASGSIGNSGIAFATNDIVGIAVDATARLLWYRINGGSWLPSGDPALGTGGQNISAVTGAIFPALQFNTSGDQITSNFGATAYSQTPPSGYGNW